MTGTHQRAYQLTAGACCRCGKDDILEDQPLLVWNASWGLRGRYWRRISRMAVRQPVDAREFRFGLP